jgi:hypothetical protein
VNPAVETHLLRLSATTLSSRIAPLFDQTARGTVVATFARSCYLELRGRIVAVVAAELLNGPLNLLVSLPSETTLLHIPRGSDVVTRGSLEIAGRLTIGLTSAQRWSPRIEPLGGAGAGLPQLTPALASIQIILDRDAPQGSFARTAGRPQRATEGMVRLAAAFRSGEAALAGRAATDLAGLGPGLTPSGDDVLAGALLAVAVSEPADAERLRTEIMASVRGRTSRISEAYLAAAADGDAGEAWHTLVAMIRRGEVPAGNKSLPHSRVSTGDRTAGDPPGGSRGPDIWEAAVRRIIAFGETSGADMLSGFVLGMTALRP